MANKCNWEGVRVTDVDRVEADGGFTGPTGDVSIGYSASGAIDPNIGLAVITGSGTTNTIAVPSGGFEHRMTVIRAGGPGTTTVTPSGLLDGTSIDLSSGQVLELQYVNSSSPAYSGWKVLHTDGTVS